MCVTVIAVDEPSPIDPLKLLAARLDAVIALVVSVPASASASVASSTIPFTSVVASEEASVL